jgi:hypothetical protein
VSFRRARIGVVNLAVTRTAVLAIGLLTLAACGSSGERATPPSASVPTASATPPSTLSPTPTPTPTPTAKPKPKPAPPPKAKDGTDLAACRDGRCEVLVKPGASVRFNGGTLKVGKIGKFMEFTISGNYGGSGQLGPGCVVTFKPGGVSTRCGTNLPSQAKDPRGITLRVPYVGMSRAILNMHKV